MGLSKLVVLVFLVGWASCDLTNDDGLTLEVVQVVFRHGERTPHKYEAKLISNKADRAWEKLYGFAQLTNKGKLQEYEIGRMLRENYDKFLGEEYRPDSIMAVSSNRDRTKASLQLVLASLFRPTNDSTWNKDVLWNPLPIHYVPWPLDNFFNIRDCSEFEILYKELMTSEDMEEMLAPFKNVFKLMSKEYPKIDIDLEQMFYINNLIIGSKVLDLNMPKWYTPVLGEKVKYLAKLYLETLSYNEDLIKFNGGAMVSRMLNNMQAPERKMYLYSGHEYQVHALAAAHGLYVEKSPPFGSAIILEKRRDYMNNTFIRMFEWNLNDKLTLKRMCNNEEYCSLKEYLALVNPILPSEEDLKCLYKNVNPGNIEQYLKIDDT